MFCFSRNNLASVTGHTGGIGGEIAKALEARGYEVNGFSIENGFDLSEDGTIGRIVDSSRDSSVFINCAEHGFSQTELLYALCKRWKTDPAGRAIVNISSISPDGIWDFMHPYAVQKTALEKASQQIWAAMPELRMMTIRPGIVDTKMSRRYHGNKLPVERVVSAVMWMLDQPEDTLIRDLSIMVHGPEGKDAYGDRTRFNRI